MDHINARMRCACLAARARGRAMTPYSLNPYWTIRIPYTDRCATKWHPTEATGPFSVLTRGAFPSRGEACRWAIDNLGHTGWEPVEKYTIVQITSDATDSQGNPFKGRFGEIIDTFRDRYIVRFVGRPHATYSFEAHELQVDPETEA